MTLIERLKTLPDHATIDFKWQDGEGKWQAEAVNYSVKELKDMIFQREIVNFDADAEVGDR